jgi:hypothetical protein
VGWRKESLSFCPKERLSSTWEGKKGALSICAVAETAMEMA